MALCLARPALAAVAASLLLALTGCSPDKAPAPAAETAAQPQPAAEVFDPAALKPPAGAPVALVEFADLQCPACAAANPLLNAAVARYRIPWVRHDFLIPAHNWSRQAAINARWFDLQNRALGDEYRDQVFAGQNTIFTPDALRQFTEKFAADHKIGFPFAVDPQGKLEAEVMADNDLGKRTGIQETPTVFVVTAGGKGAPFVHVRDFRSGLNPAIERALADATGK